MILGVCAESSSLDNSIAVGVHENADGWMVTIFLGELCLAPEGLLCLFETLRAEGSDEDLADGGVGEEREDVGALELDCGVTGAMFVGATEAKLALLKGLIGLEL